MALDNEDLMPPTSRFAVTLETIGAALAPLCETVRYFLRLPEEENKDKVLYVEFESPLTLENESLESSQRSWLSFKVVVYGYITEPDSRVLANFIHEVADRLYTPSIIQNCYSAFGPNNGFSIERLTVAEIGFGEEYGQFKIVLECLMHHPDISEPVEFDRTFPLLLED